MYDLKSSIERLMSADRFIDNYRQHPNMDRVQMLKLQLKQEKLRDKIVYQSFRAKTATQVRAI